MNIHYVTYARFVEFFGKEGDIEVIGTSSIFDALQQLTGTDEKKQTLLFDENGIVRRYVILLKNGERIQNEDAHTLLLQDGDNLTIYPPVSGG